MFLTEKQALDILGPNRVLTKRQVIECWNGLIEEERRDDLSLKLNPNRKTNLRYSEDTVNEFSKKRMWRLVFDPGFSFLKMKDILGEDCRQSPHFCRQNRGWRENLYSSKKRRPGYVLIRSRPDFSNLQWQEQEERTDINLYRASAALALNTILTFFITGRKSWLSGSDYWGTERDSEETRCAVGLRKRGCIFIYNFSVDCANPFLGVCLVKQFDI